MSLDLSSESLRTLLYQACDIAVDLYAGLEDRPVMHDKSPAEVRALFEEPLPQVATDLSELLKRVDRDVFNHVSLNISPHWYPWVTTVSTPAGLVGALLDAALNVNNTTWLNAASGAELERRAVQWIAEFIGYPSDTGGVLVSGGSEATRTGLAVACRAKAPFDVATSGMRGGPPLTVYASTETHAAVDKSINFLGLGTDQLRKIPVTRDFTIDLGELVTRIRADRAHGLHPVCVVGNAGTINTGAVDPLDDLADVCRKHDLWFHVDGAYGGPAAATRLAGPRLQGLDRADSVAIDAHKWLFVPFEAGCALVRDSEALRVAHRIHKDYMPADEQDESRLNYMEHGFQLSRNLKALKIWLTFKAYGAPALREAIEGSIRVMRHLAQLVEQEPDFELMAPPSLSTVCFRYRTPDTGFHEDEPYLGALNAKIEKALETDGRVFVRTTKVGGRTALRACCTNHRREPRHVAYLLQVLREIGETIHSRCNSGTATDPGPR